MAFCDFCQCLDCYYGTRLLQHAQTRDGRWICNVCWLYDVCQDDGGQPCDSNTCHHRPEVSLWVAWDGIGGPEEGDDAAATA